MRKLLGLVVILGLGAAALAAPQALASHVRCGDTVTADTVLDDDLACSGPAPGIEIGADAVTLDLHGHSLTQNHYGPGVLNPGFEDVTIENGAIQTEISDGILLNDADRNTLRDLQVVHLLGNEFTSPIQLNRSDEGLIEGNVVSGWVRAIRLTESNRIVITGNRTGYFPCALEGDCSTFATGGSVILRDSDDNVVERNSLSQGISGLDGAGSDRNLFRRNSVTLSVGTGLFMYGGEDNVVEKNRILHNSAVGIDALGTRIRIEKNDVSDNGGDGIVVYDPSSIVLHNVARGNGDDGIRVASAGIVVGHNQVTENRDLGIDAVPGVIDGGGNKGSGNGNPQQCVNITCK
jgi:parallel beta-helix repeat protein